VPEFLYKRYYFRNFRENIILFQQKQYYIFKILMSIDGLAKEILLLIINNFEAEPVCLKKFGDKTVPSPSRRNILNLYCTCKNFTWLENLSISSALRYKEESTRDMYQTFDIFGSEIGIQIISDYAMYCVDGITGFYFGDNIEFMLVYPFTSYAHNELTDYYRVNCAKGFVEKNDAIFTLTKMSKQMNEIDPDFYLWLIRSLNGYNKLLVRYKNKQNYSFEFMDKINLDVHEDL
jgi:hypothetical protein